MITAVVDEDGVRDLYDYSSKDLLNQPLRTLIPSLDPSHVWQDEISNLRFFGSCTKRGAQFPVIARQEENSVRIISIPVIAGLMTIKRDGIIEGCNDIFVKYLFGFSQSDLVEKKNISCLLPQFPTLFDNLRRDDLIQPGLIINNIICRKLLISTEQQKETDMLLNNNKRLLTHTPHNQPLPILVAIHRDGTPFEVQLQLKLVETDEEEEYALWISFHREIAFKRFGHPHLISLPPQPQQKKKNPLPSSEKNEERYKSVSIPCETIQEGSVYDIKSVPLASPPIVKATVDEDIVYSAQTKAVSIKDYSILDTLGQGAYGLVKLAVKRNDPSQVRISY